jgi:hypothetical protein
MSRNAYEIRLETLCLARDILSENLHVKNDQAVKRAERKSTGVEVTEQEFDGWYTAEDVIEKAKVLYEFVAPSDEGKT